MRVRSLGFRATAAKGPVQNCGQNRCAGNLAQILEALMLEPPCLALTPLSLNAKAPKGPSLTLNTKTLKTLRTLKTPRTPKPHTKGFEAQCKLISIWEVCGLASCLVGSAHPTCVYVRVWEGGGGEGRGEGGGGGEKGGGGGGGGGEGGGRLLWSYNWQATGHCGMDWRRPARP